MREREGGDSEVLWQSLTMKGGGGGGGGEFYCERYYMKGTFITWICFLFYFTCILYIKYSAPVLKMDALLSAVEECSEGFDYIVYTPILCSTTKEPLLVIGIRIIM